MYDLKRIDYLVDIYQSKVDELMAEFSASLQAEIVSQLEKGDLFYNGMGAAVIKSKRAQEIENKMSKEDDDDKWSELNEELRELNEKILEFTGRIEELICGEAITAAPDITEEIQL